MDSKINYILDRLSLSKFRSSFHLKDKDFAYTKEKGLDRIESHAHDFISKRLKDVSNMHDGKQTPMKGHPVFIAQHATATCCRGCLEKWYHIDRNKILSKEEEDYVVLVIMTWIKREINKNNNK